MNLGIKGYKRNISTCIHSAVRNHKCDCTSSDQRGDSIQFNFVVLYLFNNKEKPSTLSIRDVYFFSIIVQ